MLCKSLVKGEELKCTSPLYTLKNRFIKNCKSIDKSIGADGRIGCFVIACAVSI